MATTLVNSFFPGLNLTQNINAINGFVPGAPINSYDLATINPMFYIGKDDTGSDILCCVKTDQATLTVVTITGSYKATLVPQVTAASCILVGGRPIHRPI